MIIVFFQNLKNFIANYCSKNTSKIEMDFINIEFIFNY